MKPNFEAMSTAELKVYVLSHRDDDEAIRTLFSRRNPPDSEATWYGPMCTPDGLPIEENIQIAEEAIRKRAEIDRGNTEYTHQTRTQVTSEEIAQYRAELADYPQALEALNVIEKCEGNLEDATLVLARRARIEVVRSPKLLDEYAKQLRYVLCRKEFREDLLNNSFNVVVAYLFINPPTIPLAMITPVLIYVTKRGLNKWCEDS